MKVNKTKAVILSVAVAFVSVFFFAYAIQSIYPAPQFEDFCGDANKPMSVNNQVDCESVGGLWNPSINNPKGVEYSGYCDINYQCVKDYDKTRSLYERNVFFANLGIGIVVFVIAFFLGIEAVSSGLMGGAVMLMIYSSMRYWGELSNAWRTLMLGVTLSILIWLGYRRLKD